MNSRTFFVNSSTGLRLLSKILEMRFFIFTSIVHSGIAAHAMEWIAKIKYVTPPIDPFYIVGVIIQHYPSTLGMAIRGRYPTTTNELLAILTEFEESRSFCDHLDSRSTDIRLRNR